MTVLTNLKALTGCSILDPRSSGCNVCPWKSHNNDEANDVEEQRENKAALLTERIINLLMALLDADYDKDSAISPLVTMVLVRLIEGCCTCR